MKALILAAGLGTRLMPLTADIPKALVKVGGMTLLERAVRKLDSEGFSEIIVNVHHHGPKVIEFLAQLEVPGVNIAISDETGQLLDTGGGILKARWFLDGKEPFLVYNVDIITTLSLRKLFDDHLHNQCLATLAVSDRETSRYLLFDRAKPALRMEGYKRGECALGLLPCARCENAGFQRHSCDQPGNIRPFHRNRPIFRR